MPTELEWNNWISQIKSEALTKGISQETLDNQFKNKSILLTGSPSIKVKDVMVMIKSILGDKISLEFKDEEIKGHYGLTPYSFRPKIAEKYIVHRDQSQLIYSSLVLCIMSI